LDGATPVIARGFERSANVVADHRRRFRFRAFITTLPEPIPIL
jgi:hypothetical protein